MTQQTKDQHQKQGHTHTPHDDQVNKEKQKAEELEVTGRHKNDGKNDNAGHKTSRE